MSARLRSSRARARRGDGEPRARKPRATSASVTEAAAPAAYVGPRDPDIMALEETLSENLGLKVSINDRGQSGEIMIAYNSLEQLDDILRRLGGSICATERTVRCRRAPWIKVLMQLGKFAMASGSH